MGTDTLKNPEAKVAYDAFLQGLRELGYVVGKNVTIEFVITSYSIHYTKLYDENVAPGDFRFDSFLPYAQLHCSDSPRPDDWNE